MVRRQRTVTSGEIMKYEILLKLIDKVDYFWNFLYITTGTVWVFLVGNNCQLQVYQKNHLHSCICGTYAIQL